MRLRKPYSIPTGREFRIDNFSLGMRRDGATTENRMYALRTIKNYYIDYTEGKLVIRPGYSRYNSIALPNPADQLYWFGDMDGNQHLLGKIGNPTYTWYKIAATGAHTNICAHACTSRRPAFSFGNRVFFGTDKDITEVMAGGNGLQWSDNTSIGTGDSYRVGIKKPASSPTLYNTTAEGRTATADSTYEITNTTQYKIGIPYIPSYNAVMGSIRIQLFRRNTDFTAGNVRVVIQSNSGGSPDGTTITNGTSDWVSMASLTKGGSAWITFNFPKSLELSASTTYWFVVEGDAAYYLTYAAIEAIHGAGNYSAGVRMEGTPASYTYGSAKKYNIANSTWSTLSAEAMFYISGLTETEVAVNTGFYDYIITYYNSTYGIESRKSPYSRVKVAQYDVVYLANYPTATDGQVDKIRIYRRKLDADATGSEKDDDITEPYYFVYEIDAGYAFYDTLSDDMTGAELQTDDHYCLDETDEEATKLRETEIHPKIACEWKGRVWAANANSNILYMSKKLEQDGATGLTGDLIPDYFPLENKIEIGCPSTIKNIKVMPSDELAVYFANSSIRLISGANDIQNPPSDIYIREVSSDIGLVSSVAVDGFRGRHILLSRHGLYAFNGTPVLEKLSGYIQSILNSITDANIDDSIVTTIGDEVWLLVDDDNDGSLNGIYILDISQNPVTWRLYDYGVKLNDLIVRQVGTEYKTLFAADAVNKYVLQLNTGTADNAGNITAEIETHPFRGKNRMSLFDVAIDAYYPSTVPTYTITITDHSGNTDSYTLSPSSSEDIRGHHTGVRVTSDPQARVKVSQSAQLANELLSIAVGYVER